MYIIRWIIATMIVRVFVVGKISASCFHSPYTNGSLNATNAL